MIDAIVRLSVERRYLMLSMILVLIGVGVWSFQRLPIDAVPDITNVQVQINTEAPGYSPLEAEQRITFPVETALYGLPKLSYTRSLSRYGLSQVTVVFEEGTDIYFARNLINGRLGSIKSVLPPGMEPEMGPIATGLGEIFMYTVDAIPGATRENGEPWDATALREVQDWIIRPQLAQVPGVIEINTIGGYEKQYHVTPSPKKLLEVGVSLEELVAALRANNANPWCRLYRTQRPAAAGALTRPVEDHQRHGTGGDRQSRWRTRHGQGRRRGSHRQGAAHRRRHPQR